MAESNKVSVTIQGNTYTIKGGRSKEHINKLAKHVDHIMEELSKSNTLLNRSMVAVLCAINLADQLYLAQKNVAQLEDQLLEYQGMPELKDELDRIQRDSQYYIEQYKEAQRALTETKLELESYKEMVDSYKNKIKQNKIEIDAARQTITDLQNQIFDNQIEMVKMKKELDDYKNKESLNKKYQTKGNKSIK
jgi:cell division protein ZapA